MKIAFWNINLGTSSFKDKTATLTTWCAAMKPDLLFLEEVSSNLTKNDWEALVQATGMKPLNNVATLDVNGGNSTKELAALCQPGDNRFAATPLRLSGLTSIRMALKVVDTTSKLQVYGIHANASTSGGNAAVEAATNLLASGDYVVVGGDFNCDSTKVKGAIIPSRFDGFPLPFTQWNAEGNNLDPKLQQQQFGFTGATYVNKPLKPGPYGPIDFILHGKSITAAPVPNAPNEANWRDIVAFFDHCPVVYKLN